MTDTLERARRLVEAGGSGTASDVESVANEAVRLPAFVIDAFERKSIRIVACRESVTDFETSLRNVIPRGWEGTGRTWDSVPGTYFQDKRRVVIATIANGTGRAVPTSASRKHGSANLVVHESLHGFDYMGDHVVLANGHFTAARDTDFNRLGDYERQLGRAGLEETYAESGARFVEGPDQLQVDWPHLFQYWEDGHAASPGQALLQPEAVAADAPIGTAMFSSDGAITLDLRAEGPGGAIGHAVITIEADDPAHATVSRHLLEGAPISESVIGTPIPFRPMRAPVPEG